MSDSGWISANSNAWPDRPMASPEEGDWQARGVASASFSVIACGAAGSLRPRCLQACVTSAGRSRGEQRPPEPEPLRRPEAVHTVHTELQHSPRAQLQAQGQSAILQWFSLLDPPLLSGVINARKHRRVTADHVENPKSQGLRGHSDKAGRCSDVVQTGSSTGNASSRGCLSASAPIVCRIRTVGGHSLGSSFSRIPYRDFYIDHDIGRRRCRHDTGGQSACCRGACNRAPLWPPSGCARGKNAR